MKKRFTATVAFVLPLLMSGPAAAFDRIWGDHAWPYTFLFGNHIDSHLDLHLWHRDLGRFSDIDKGDLTGWFYVFDSGESLDDGTPVLRHCTGPEHYAAGCVAGWRVHAKPCIEEVNDCRAMFLYHYHDHPVWMLDPTVDSQDNLRGSRQHIVQPGSYTHMHWLTEGSDHDGNFLPSSIGNVEAVFGVDIDVPEACNVSQAEALATGTVCPGYFLQIKALRPFGYRKWAFHHGGESLVLTPGVDNKTHLNLVTSYQAVAIPPEVLDDLPPYSEGGGGGHE